MAKEGNKMLKVENMTSSNGNDIPNQFIIRDTENSIRIFQSYSSIIAVIRYGKVILDTNKWDYSVTTGKYRNKFLGESIAETRKKIASGEYMLANLNNDDVKFIDLFNVMEVTV